LAKQAGWRLQCNVLVAGYLRGNIIAQGKVDLAPTAKLYGDMKVKNLLIEEGAIFKGNCLMERDDPDRTKTQQLNKPAL